MLLHGKICIELHIARTRALLRERPPGSIIARAKRVQ